MKGAMMIFAPLSLVLSLVLLGDCMTIRFTFPQQKGKPTFQQTYPLDMAEKSIDDMYFGCYQESMDTVMQKYEDEKKGYNIDWKKTKKCVEDRRNLIENTDLTERHLEAICVYSGEGVYRDFNEAVREQRNQYGTTFKFHYLHFMLTSAIQILNSNQNCSTTYRRVKSKGKGKKGKIIRFGSFASSSLRTDLKHFGSETCFQIKTCLGAFLKDYSSFPGEEEVLIPPYEMFKITKTYSKSWFVKPDIEGLTDCKRVYVLETVGVHSNLNCKAING